MELRPSLMRGAHVRLSQPVFATATTVYCKRSRHAHPGYALSFHPEFDASLRAVADA